MKPAARFYRKGEKRPPASPPDAFQQEASAAAVAAVKAMVPGLGPKADMIVHTAIATYVLTRAKQAYKNDEIRRMLTSERPWDMVRLAGKTDEEEAVIAAALPIVGELAQEIDPTGTKPFFQYSREEVTALFEAVIYVWEENRGRVRAPDRLYGDLMPPLPKPETAPPAAPAMAVPTMPTQPRYSSVLEDDDIPF
jgi:hypothetical protein